MPQDQSLPPELAAFEARLAALSPCSAGTARDELMYRAGYAAAEAALVEQSAETVRAVELAARDRSARPERTWVWQTSTVVLALVVLMFVVVQFTPQTPEVTTPVAPVPPSNLAGVPSPRGEGPGGEYLVLRERVMRQGLEGLHAPQVRTTSETSAEAPDYRQWRRELLGG